MIILIKDILKQTSFLRFFFKYPSKILDNSQAPFQTSHHLKLTNEKDRVLQLRHFNFMPSRKFFSHI